MNLRVFVVSWQLEENSSILRLGQDVEWRLAFRETGWWPLEPDEHVQHLHAFGCPTSWEGQVIDRFPTELAAGGATLYWDAPDQVQGEAQLVGSVHRDVGSDTPEGFPSSRGVLQRLRMETRRYKNTGNRWTPVDNTAEYEEVQETSLPPSDFPYANFGADVNSNLVVRIETEATDAVIGRPLWTGVLVDLETDASLS